MLYSSIKYILLNCTYGAFMIQNYYLLNCNSHRNSPQKKLTYKSISFIELVFSSVFNKPSVKFSSFIYIAILTMLTGLSVSVNEPAFAGNAQIEELERAFENNTKGLKKEKAKPRLPKYTGPDFGALEKSRVKLKLKNIVPIFTVKPVNEEVKEFVLTTIAKNKSKIKTISQVAGFVKALEGAIVQKGYPMIRVLLPKQKLNQSGAVIKIVVISGNIENINMDITANSENDKENIKSILIAFLEDLKDEKYLKYDQINRQLLLLRRTYGINTRIFLSKGETQGKFNINAKSKYEQFQNIWNVNNNLATSYGVYSLQYSFINNFVFGGYSQKMSAFIIGSFKQEKDTYYRLVSLSYNGLSSFGGELSLKTSLSRSTATVGNGFPTFGETFSYSASYKLSPIVSFERTWDLTGELAIDKSTLQGVSSETYVHFDKTVDIFLISNYNYKSNIYSHDFEIKYGIGLDILDAKATQLDVEGVGTNIPSSKSSATTEPRIISGRYSITVPLPANYSNTLTISGQSTNNEAVLSSKYFSITGSGKVEGLVNNSISGNEGFVVSNKFSFPAQTVFRNLVIPFISLAYGQASLVAPTSGESPRTIGKSVTFGVTIPIAGFNFNLKYSLARKTAFETINTDKQYFGFSLASSF